jgi:hypothetical protein
MKTSRITVLKPRRRFSFLTVIAAAAGAFGAAVLMSTTTASAAHADVYSDLIAAVDADYAAGQVDLTAAFTDFNGGDFGPGLAAFFEGVDAYSIVAPQNLIIGTVQALSNESFSGPSLISFDVPADFAAAQDQAQLIFNVGEAILNLVPTNLASGEYANAFAETLLGTDLTTVVSLEELLLGAAVSF